MPRHEPRSENFPACCRQAAARLGSVALLGLTLTGCTGDDGRVAAAQPQNANESTAAAESAGAATTVPNPLRNVYFGDLHTHTNFSYDAFLNGTRATPDDAYRYAQGEPLTHAAGFQIQLDRPLDFFAVTDHASFLGMLPAMLDPEQEASRHPDAELARRIAAGELTGAERGAAYADIRAHTLGTRDGLLDLDVVRSAWRETIAAAERHNDPGRFTTFIAYEFTGSPENQNLHRNVIFRGSAAPEVPFSRLDSFNPEELWAWMDRNREAGIEALAIPHNSNGSNGLMFRLATYAGEPLDAAYTEIRTRNEPLVEITQTKGTSDTHPALSPNDEWADFEIWSYRIGGGTTPSQPQGSYVREAYLNGLRLEEEQGINPFRFGLVGATDNHAGSGAPAESDYFTAGGRPQRGASIPFDPPRPDGSLYSASPLGAIRGASGLTGVWAEENTRESIYDAFQRKETFATTGPRIRLRFFAGYDYPNDLAENPDLVAAALRRRRGHGRRAGRTGRPRSEVPGLGEPRSGGQPAGPRPGHQGVDRRRRGARARLRRRLLGRNVGGSGDAPLPRQRRDGGPRHLRGRRRRRRRRAAHVVDRSRLRSGAARRLLRAGAREPVLPLVHLGGGPRRRGAASRSSGHHPGAGLVVADLDHALTATTQRIATWWSREAAPAARTQHAAGGVLAGMLVLAIAGAVWPAVPDVSAAMLAWVALALLWPGIGRRQQLQALVFIAAGLAAFLWGASRGAPLRVDSLLGQNQPILSMLASITLLRLLNRPPRTDEPELPRGLRAYLQSMLGVHAFGSVINISAVIIMCDRLTRVRPLGFNQAQLFSRAFSAVAFYSPFIGGVALALSYTPGSSPLVMMLFGLPLAAAAFLLLYRFASSGRAEDVGGFRGYPLHPQDLKVPLALGAGVLIASVALPGYSVLTLITMVTPAVVVGVLLKRSGMRGLRPAFAEYVRERAPQMGGELALFLGAGVLAAGVVAAAAGAGDWTIFPRLDAFHASLLVLACIVTSLVCIHPAVLVGVTVALVETIEVDPTLLATTFAMGWGPLGCAVNPLSGVNVVLATRYGADNWRIARSNVAFSAALFVVAVGLLYLYEYTRL